MRQNDIIDAFQTFYKYWEEKTPHSSEYLPFDLLDFFKAGIEAARELTWHNAEEDPGYGKTVVAHDVDGGDMEVSYGGGRIERGKWAYAEEIFSTEMMETVREREADLAAWLEGRRQREPEIESL